MNRINGKIKHSLKPFTIFVIRSEVEPAFAAIYKGFISELTMHTAVRHMEVIRQVQDHYWASRKCVIVNTLVPLAPK
jgi:hypothetical protein